MLDRRQRRGLDQVDHHRRRQHRDAPGTDEGRRMFGPDDDLGRAGEAGRDGPEPLLTRAEDGMTAVNAVSIREWCHNPACPCLSRVSRSFSLGMRGAETRAWSFRLRRIDARVRSCTVEGPPAMLRYAALPASLTAMLPSVAVLCGHAKDKMATCKFGADDQKLQGGARNDVYEKMHGQQRRSARTRRAGREPQPNWTPSARQTSGRRRGGRHV